MDLGSRNETYRRVSAEDEEMYMRLPVPPVSQNKFSFNKILLKIRQSCTVLRTLAKYENTFIIRKYIQYPLEGVFCDSLVLFHVLESNHHNIFLAFADSRPTKLQLLLKQA